jgi:hypothetical protein
MSSSAIVRRYLDAMERRDLAMMVWNDMAEVLGHKLKTS